MAKPRHSLSELEAFVLGLIWQFGPCSPYDVRVHMKRSPSTQWSASTGAIYPLVAKLQRQGLIAAQAKAKNPRGRRAYRTTPAGAAALRTWIGPPLAKEAISVTYDPLRTRARFLAALTPAKRKAWIKNAAAALDDVERLVTVWHKTYATSGPFVRLLTRNAELELAARRQWIKEAAKLLT